MRISVVMPSYNREAYLSEAIESVLNQSFKDFEFIIVDDGSTDGSHYLYDYYKNDKRVKVELLGKNMGIAYARNHGIKCASGEYIAVMDSDDVMVIDRLKLSLRAIKDVDFVYSPYGVFDGQDIKNHIPPAKVTLEDVEKNGAWPHVTIMAKRKCFIENPYKFRSNDDAWLVWQWFKAGYKSKMIKYPTMVVRYHQGNVSKTKQKEVEDVNRIIQEEIRNYRREQTATH